MRRGTGPDADRLAFDDGERTLSFAGLLERATELAAAAQRRGVKPGDRVALVMSSGVSFVELFWGLQLAGAVPCAFNPFLPEVMLQRRIESIRPSFVLSADQAAELHPLKSDLVEAPSNVDEPALFQFTSGTSGEPRVAMISHRNVSAYLQGSSEGLRSDDVFVNWVPPWHDLGLLAFVIGPVHYGVSCHLVEPAVRMVPRWLDTIARVGGTVTGAPDFGYRIAARIVDPASLDLSSLRKATIGAEPIRRSTIDRFEDQFGVPGALCPAYGLAEATLGVTTHLSGDEVVADERDNVSCGFALRGVEVRAGRAAEAPEEILVRGDVVFAGYFGAPEESRQTLRDGWLHTGDFGYTDADGRLFVLGRRSGMIKRAGAVIAPRELEDSALRADGVRAAAAISLPQKPHGDDTIVVMAETETSAPSSAAEISAAVTREILAALGFAPGRVMVVPPRTITRTINGKVQYDVLRRAVLDGEIE